MRDHVILDLDGTLAKIGWRSHFAKQKRWDEFHALSIYDDAHEDALDLIKSIDRGVSLIIITGRPESQRAITNQWLSRYGLLHRIGHMSMRADGDFSSDASYKVNALINYFGSLDNAKARVMFAIDDRDKVVEAFRAVSIPCWQVRPGLY